MRTDLHGSDTLHYQSAAVVLPAPLINVYGVFALYFERISCFLFPLFCSVFCYFLLGHFGKILIQNLHFKAFPAAARLQLQLNTEFETSSTFSLHQHTQYSSLPCQSKTNLFPFINILSTTVFCASLLLNTEIQISSTFFSSSTHSLLQSPVSEVEFIHAPPPAKGHLQQPFFDSKTFLSCASPICISVSYFLL